MIGIRREDKNRWERRTPLIPKDVIKYVQQGYKFVVQPSPIRAFADEQYRDAGAKIEEDLSDVELILGIKEIPVDKIIPDKTYMIFSHTVKGQKYNMAMLKKIMDTNSTLIDYELIRDDKGRRLIFFGKYAGNAGIVDTLSYLGKRLASQGIDNPFFKLQQAYRYETLDNIKNEMEGIGQMIKEKGLSEDLVPFVVGIAGYGHVSQGVQEVLSSLPVEEISPTDIDKIPADKNKIFKVIFKEKDLVRRNDEGNFELQEYYNYPQFYHSVFSKYLPYLTVLMNTIYWDQRYPRLLTKEDAKNYKKWRLKIIGDISCDVDGAIEITVKDTDPGNPVYLYDPLTGEIVDGYKGEGLLVMAVSNLPAEIPVDSSVEFSRVLSGFLHDIVNSFRGEFPEDFNEWKIPSFIKRSVIVFRGKLTPDYLYLEDKIKEVQ